MMPKTMGTIFRFRRNCVSVLLLLPAALRAVAQLARTHSGGVADRTFRLAHRQSIPQKIGGGHADGYDIAVRARLDVRELSVELPGRSGWMRPVNEVSFTLGEGESLGIVGESGSGKTLLCLTLMRLLPPGARCKGEALLHSHSASAADRGAPAGVENLVTASLARMRALRGREIAMIFQEPMTSLNPVMRVGTQIAEAIRVHETRLGENEVRVRVEQALEQAAVPEAARRARQYPHQLSGGLRQRVMIAMALAAKPSVLIADEPTTALDVTVQQQVLELLGNLRREMRLSLLFITHDLGVVAQIADRIAVMYAGRIVEEGQTREVLRAPRHPYTEGLLRAAPRLEGGKLTPISGAVPALDALPAGCAFGPRCGSHGSKCDAAMPELLRVAGGGEGHKTRCILSR